MIERGIRSFDGLLGFSKSRQHHYFSLARDLALIGSLTNLEGDRAGRPLGMRRLGFDKAPPNRIAVIGRGLLI